MRKKVRFTILSALSKRRKFVIISILLSLGIIVVQAINDDLIRFGVIGSLAVVTGGLTIWSLKEDLNKIGYFMAPILPAFFITSLNLFYFLLPENLLIQAGLVVLFAIGMYALLLTENIFVVASIRTIQLLRAAQASGFVFSLFTAFLLLDTIFSYRLAPWINAPLVFFSMLPLILHGNWSSRLDESLESDVLWYSLALAWVLGQGTFFISLWPVSIVIASLFIVTLLYVGLGIIQQALMGRLFKQTIREYFQVGIIVFIIVFFAARWGGQ